MTAEESKNLNFKKNTISQEYDYSKNKPNYPVALDYAMAGQFNELSAFISLYTLSPAHEPFLPKLRRRVGEGLSLDKEQNQKTARLF